MAGLGGFVSGLFGSENKERAKGRQVDPNAYQYGGAPGGADEAANRYRQQAEGAQVRQATQAQNVGVDYSQANQDRAQQQQARQGQNSLAAIMANRATGGGPTIADQRANLDMQRARAAQASQAASARGAAGLALAGQNAAGNIANAQSQISNNAQINSAQERRDDTNAAASMYGAMRGGDQNAQAQSANQAQFQTQSQAQQNQFNAGLRDAQSGRNDAFTLGMTNNEMGVRNAQMAGGMNREAQQSANDLGAQQINAQVAGQNAAMNQKNAEGVIGLAGKGLGVVAGALAKGGPTTEGKPYLVGEQGPELIVPKKDGYVLTHDQTKQALSGSPAETITSLFDRGHAQTRSASLANIMARCNGGPMPARADGGAVEAGGEAPPSALAPSGYTPPMQTWGVGSPDPNSFAWSNAQEQDARMAPYDDLSARITAQRDAQNATAARVNESVGEIDRRDKDAIWNADYKERHGQKMSREEEDAATEARYRQAEDSKQKREVAKEKRKKSLSDILKGGGDEQTPGVDVAYHGGTSGYVPPQLIPIGGARAFGGPIMGGGAGGVGGLVPLTPMRPDQPQPMMGPGSGGGATSYEVLNNGGEDVAASGKAMSDFATKYNKNPGASPIAGMREEGGPVEGGGGKGDQYEPRLRPSTANASKPYVVPDHERDDMHQGFWSDPSGYGATTVVEKDAPMVPKYRYENGERVPVTVREPVSFERDRPEADEHEAAAKRAAAHAAVQAATAGAAVGAPAAAAGIAHWINALLARRGR